MGEFFLYFGFLRRNSNIANIHTMPINDIHMLYDLHLALYRNSMGIQGDPGLCLAEIIRRKKDIPLRLFDINMYKG